MATVDHIQTRHRSGTSGPLEVTLRRLKTRILVIGIVTAIAWSLLALFLVLAVAMWMDLLWELPFWARTCAWWVAGSASLIAFATRCWWTWRKTDQRLMARRMDSAAGTGGKILAGFELSHSKEPFESAIHDGLKLMAIEQAGATATDIRQRLVVPARSIRDAYCWVGAVFLAAAALALLFPSLASTQWNRFVNPYNDTPPFSLLQFTVQPGNADVVYGCDLEVQASLSESTADDVELVWVDDSGQQQTVPMFSAGEDHWRTVLARVEKPASYFVRSGRARSERYSVSVILVPEIRKAVARITPPEYTAMKTTTGPIPAEGIRGLAGTKVAFDIESNRPLSGGLTTISHQATEQQVQLTPDEHKPNLATGSFQIQDNGKFEIFVTDVSGLRSSQSVSGSIVKLDDHRPFVRITEPRPFSMATPDANLPVAILAEDDYGISRLELYRSLNDSRPIPRTITVDGMSARFTDRSYLPLAQYQLQPGDEIKLFARVEDNDPAGAKGSESPVHVVTIISDEQFQQMQRNKLGVEAVLAKYRQIQRQLEQLDKLANEQADNAAKESDAQITEQLSQAAEQFKREAQTMRQLAKQTAPIDFDQELSQRIQEMADKLDQMSSEIENLANQMKAGKLSREQFQKQLNALRSKLGMERESFAEEVMKPLDGLAKAFPLMALQSDFVQLVLRQRNLAERLRSFDGKDNLDDPDVKRRMRELAEEQQQLYDMLDEILVDIEEKALALPDEEQFDRLKQSALDFVYAVDDSEAFPEMEKAAFGLEEFSGSQGYRHADRAAEILESFLSKCESMSKACESACKLCFNPSLGCPKLGSSIPQLLSMLGKGVNGSGSGSAGNGFSQRSMTAQNIGLYGSMPITSANNRGSGQGDRQGSGGYDLASEQASRSSEEITTSSVETGSSDVKIPIQYESKVGEYFRRIVEENGTSRK